MQSAAVHTDFQTRDLLRLLRRPPNDVKDEQGQPGMPESFLWNVFIELRRRGDDRANSYFLSSVRALHRRRTLGGAELPTLDPDPNEHRLTEDPFLGELWRAYKKCIHQNRTGPAAQLLRDIESQLVD